MSKISTESAFTNSSKINSTLYSLGRILFLYVDETSKGFVGMVYLCRRGECYSTVMGVRGYSIWWPRPAARSPSGRRRSKSLLLDKRPFQSSAHWWRQRQGSCMARTFQLGGRTKLYVTKILYLSFSTVDSNTDIHISTREKQQARKRQDRPYILYFMEV